MVVAAAAAVVVGVMSLTTPTVEMTPRTEKRKMVRVEQKLKQEAKERRLEAKRQAELAAQEAAQAAEVSAPTASGSRWSSVIPCESGGDPNIFSSTGKYWGLYQFDYSTWVAHGGDPNSWGNASAAEQHAIADRVQYDAWPNC